MSHTVHCLGQSIDVTPGRRLINALREQVDIGHRCGGIARCTTCRVRFSNGEPTHMTVAERDKLADADALGDFRLACQITVDGNLTVEALMRVSEEGWDGAGPEPAETIEPEPIWVESPATSG
ncbi:MAG: 2Fe-2S iron-sulfur cluster-binding protein [Acidobacteriota bacterium]